MKDDTLDWWTKYYASHHSDPKMLEKAEDYLNAGGDTLQVMPAAQFNSYLQV